MIFSIHCIERVYLYHISLYDSIDLYQQHMCRQYEPARRRSKKKTKQKYSFTVHCNIIPEWAKSFQLCCLCFYVTLILASFFIALASRCSFDVCKKNLFQLKWFFLTKIVFTLITPLAYLITSYDDEAFCLYNLCAQCIRSSNFSLHSRLWWFCLFWSDNALNMKRTSFSLSKRINQVKSMLSRILPLIN